MPASNESNTSPLGAINRKFFLMFLMFCLLFFLYSGANTSHEVEWLKSQDNFVEVDSTWRYFAFRNIGGLVGVAVALLLRIGILKLAKRFQQ